MLTKFIVSFLEKWWVTTILHNSYLKSLERFCKNKKSIFTLGEKKGSPKMNKKNWSICKYCGSHLSSDRKESFWPCPTHSVLKSSERTPYFLLPDLQLKNTYKSATPKSSVLSCICICIPSHLIWIEQDELKIKTYNCSLTPFQTRKNWKLKAKEKCKEAPASENWSRMWELTIFPTHFPFLSHSLYYSPPTPPSFFIDPSIISNLSKSLSQVKMRDRISV